MDKICDIVRKSSEKTLNNVCNTLSVTLFRPIDVSFIMEYSKVMQTVAQALDILHEHFVASICRPEKAAAKTT